MPSPCRQIGGVLAPGFRPNCGSVNEQNPPRLVEPTWVGGLFLIPKKSLLRYCWSSNLIISPRIKAKKSTKKLNSISLLPFLLVLISVSGAIFRHLVPPLLAVESSQSPNMWLEPLHESTCFPGSEGKWEESSSQFLDSFRRQEKKNASRDSNPEAINICIYQKIISICI